MIHNRYGQVTIEVAVLFTFVVGALIFMGFYVQRAVQGAMKGNSDSFGQQFSLNTAFRSVSQAGSDATATATDTDSCTKYSHGLGVDLNQDGVVNDADKNATFDGRPPLLPDDATDCTKALVADGTTGTAPTPRNSIDDSLLTPGTLPE